MSYENPYTPPTLTGFNSAPPSDDGQRTASNAVRWATHLAKIGNPLKAYAQAISSAVTAALDLLPERLNVPDWRLGPTAEEIAAGLTIVNLSYWVGHILRYGENTTPGTTDMRPALLAALSVADCFIPFGTFAIYGRVPLTKYGIIGEGTSTNGATVRTLLVFYNQTDPALGSIYTDYPNWNRRALPLSGFTARASSWDGTTGALGHGIDITARVRIFDVTVECFKEYGVFFHNTANDGEAPYQSYCENLVSTSNGKHGIVVGTGASNVTFVNPQGKWNGATGHGVNPVATGSYDGFYVNHMDDGNPGGAFYTRLLESVQVYNGDCSYNSRYGWNIVSLDGGPMFPGYAEGNLAAAPAQANVGNGTRHCLISFGGLAGGVNGVNLAAQATIDGLANTNSIYVGGQFCGSGNSNVETSRYAYQMLHQWNWVASNSDMSNAALIRGGTDGVARLASVGTGGWIPRLKSYTNAAALPSASSEGAGAIVWVPGATGGGIVVFSDGTDWRRMDDRTVVS